MNHRNDRRHNRIEGALATPRYGARWLALVTACLVLSLEAFAQDAPGPHPPAPPGPPQPQETRDGDGLETDPVPIRLDDVPREALSQAALKEAADTITLRGTLVGELCRNHRIRIDVLGSSDVASNPRLITVAQLTDIGPFELKLPRSPERVSLVANCDVNGDGLLSSQHDLVVAYADNPIPATGDLTGIDLRLTYGFLGLQEGASPNQMRRWLKLLFRPLLHRLAPSIDYRTFYPGLALILPLLLGVRLLTPRSRPDAPWHTGIDVGLAILCGVGVTALAGWWLAPFHLNGGPLTSSDLPEHCDAVGAFRVHDWLHWTKNRSLFAGYFPMIFSRLYGLMDGLVIGALISTALTGAGLYLWARALHSRLAGMAAAALFGAVGPLAILPRTVSFYPETTAAFALAGAGAALALRYRSIPAIAAGTVGAGLALLIDARGLLWGVPILGLTLLSVVPGSIRQVVLRLAVIAALLWGAFYAGRYAYTTETASLEWRMDVRRFFWERGFEDEKFQPPWDFETSYVWGRSDPLEIPATLMFLAKQSRMAPKEWREREQISSVVSSDVTPWLLPCALALAVATLGLLRRPALLIALYGTLFPFAVALKGAISMVDLHARFLSNALAPVPVLLGVAIAVLMQGPLARRSRRSSQPATRESNAEPLQTVGDDGRDAPPLKGEGSGERSPSRDVQSPFATPSEGEGPGEGSGERPLRQNGRRPVATSSVVRPTLTLVTTLLLTLGLIPSWLSPVAPWRATVVINDEIKTVLTQALTTEMPDKPLCRYIVMKDAKRGVPPQSRIFP